MSQRNSDLCVHTLMDLGLTRLQAMTYFHLTKLERAEVNTIAKASDTYRSDTYRVMLSLEKLGLAEKIVGTPVRYKATPLREGLSLLMQIKTQELASLEQQATEAVRSVQESSHNATGQPEDPQLVICSSERLFFKIFVERHDRAKISVDSVVEWKHLRIGLIEDFPPIKKVVENGVKFRLITEQHKDDKQAQKIIQSLQKEPMFEIKYLPFPVPVNFTLYDGAQVDLCMALSLDDPTPSLWSNHPRLLEVMKTYFETLWGKSEDSSEKADEEELTLSELEIAKQHNGKGTMGLSCTF